MTCIECTLQQSAGSLFPLFTFLLFALVCDVDGGDCVSGVVSHRLYDICQRSGMSVYIYIPCF